MARVVVVGTGLGGLSAAARLAAQGHQVTVCEQAPVVGGKLGTFQRDGFVFDTGPSLLTLPAVYRDLFFKTAPRKKGGLLEDVLDVVEVDPTCRYRFADGTWVDVPNSSRARIAEAFDDAFGGGAGADWNRFMDRAGAIWDVTRGPFLESPLDGWRTLARLSRRLSDVRTVAPQKSLRALGKQYLHDPRLRTFLDRYATYTGSDPRRAPAALATVPFVEQRFGSWYVRGGLRRLGEAVRDRAVERGAVVRTGADVVAVLSDGGRAGGVRLADGETIPADVVVANADAAHLYRDLVRVPPAERSLRRATPSLSGFVLLLALCGRTPGLQHHTVLFPQDYDDEFDSVFGTGRTRAARPVPDPTVYVSAPDDPALRPDEDSEAWFVLVNAPRHDPEHGVDWDAPGLADSYADRVLATMARRAADQGFDLRDRLLWREIRTPADLERATRSPGGSIYGSSSNGPRAAFLRPANRSPLPGLFLVGGSSHPGGGLPLVGLSAAIVAEQVGAA
ncbi:MAG: phytoene desaturase family protein [Motilibacteraceae bacterium]